MTAIPAGVRERAPKGPIYKGQDPQNRAAYYHLAAVRPSNEAPRYYVAQTSGDAWNELTETSRWITRRAELRGNWIQKERDALNLLRRQAELNGWTLVRM